MVFLNHHVKKGSRISGGDDQNLFPSQQALVLLSVSIVMSFNIDVHVVINFDDYHRYLRGEGGRVSVM